MNSLVFQVTCSAPAACCHAIFRRFWRATRTSFTHRAPAKHDVYKRMNNLKGICTRRC